MKKVLLILSIFLITATSYGQEFNKWAIDVEAGIHSLNDESAVTTNSKYHLGAGARYNFNPEFGLGVNIGYDDLDLRSLEGESVNTDILTANLEATVNIFRLLDLYSDDWNLLAHGGLGASFIDGDNSYNETVLNTRAGLTALYKVSKKVALKADYSILGSVSQDRTLDGIYDNNNYGITSVINTVSVGIVAYLGKKDREHADWYQEPDATPIVNNNIVKNEYVTNSPVVNFTQEEFNEYYETYNSLYPQSEFVFFDHDKFNIKDTELNATYKVYTQLDENKTWTLVIKGFASATTSSDNYNQKLSEKRTNELFEKFVAMGIDKSRISFDSFGKDKKRSKQFVHDVARRVELIVMKPSK